MALTPLYIEASRPALLQTISLSNFVSTFSILLLSFIPAHPAVSHYLPSYLLSSSGEPGHHVASVVHVLLYLLFLLMLRF